MTKEEAVARFSEEWEKASGLSPNLTWAIFPMGNGEIEFQTAQHLLEMFEHLPGILYVKEDTDPKLIIRWAEEIKKHYEEEMKKEQLALAAEKGGYRLNLGS